MLAYIGYAAMGLVSGLFAGFFGVGGGIILIPLLIFFLGMSQKEAQGTSLIALIPPVGLLAAMEYLRAGYVTWKVHVPIAVCVALGLIIGAMFGARLVGFIDPVWLRRLFGIVVVYVGIRLILKP